MVLEIRNQELLAGLDLKTDYRTGDDDLVNDFYTPCLKASSSYDRAVGYFRSSVFVLVGQSIIEFSKRNGHIRILCSPDLSDEDIEHISQGYKERDDLIEQALKNDLETLLSQVETEGERFPLPH